MSKPQPWTKYAQAQYDEHVRFGDNPTLQCGCVLGEGIQDYGDYFIAFCPTHEAAPDLLEAAEAVLEWLYPADATFCRLCGLYQNHRGGEPCLQLEAAIAKAKGE